MEMELRNSDTSCSHGPRPSPAQSLSSAVVPKNPFQRPLHLGRPLLEKIGGPASSGSGALGFLPPPSSSAFPQPLGQGRAHLAVFSCLPVTHVLLTGSPKRADTFPVLLGVLFDFVGAPWSAAFFLSGGRWADLADFRTCLQVSRAQSFHSPPELAAPQWGFPL